MILRAVCSKREKLRKNGWTEYFVGGGLWPNDRSRLKRKEITVHPISRSSICSIYVWELPERLRIKTCSISMQIKLEAMHYNHTQLKLSSIAVVRRILPEAMSSAAFF